MIPHSLHTLVILLASSFLEIKAAAPNLDQLFQKQAAAHAKYASTAEADIVILPTSINAVAKSIPTFSPHPIPHIPRNHGHQDHHNAVKRFMKVKREPELEKESDLEVRADQYPLSNSTDSSARKDRNPSNDASSSTSSSTTASNSSSKSDSSSSKSDLSSTPIKGTYKGASSYYLFALNDGARAAVLDALVSGGFTVVRIFVSDVYANNKGSDSVSVNDGEFFSTSH